MTKIKAWEKIPKNTDKPNGSYITRIGDSAWGFEPYQFGFIVAKIQSGGKGRTQLDTNSAKYPSEITGLVRVVKGLGHVLDGDVAKGLEEAIQGQIKANTLAIELVQRMEAAVKDAA